MVEERLVLCLISCLKIRFKAFMLTKMVASFDDQLAEIFNLYSRLKKSPYPYAIKVFVDNHLIKRLLHFEYEEVGTLRLDCKVIETDRPVILALECRHEILILRRVLTLLLVVFKKLVEAGKPVIQQKFL